MRGAIRRLEAKQTLPRLLKGTTTRDKRHSSACLSTHHSSGVDATANCYDGHTTRRQWQLPASPQKPTPTRRHFSSFPSVNSLHYDEQRALELTNKLCHRDGTHKIGSFTPRMWQEATELIHYWTGFTTERALEASLALLDRLVAEQSAFLEQQKGKTSGPKSPSLAWTEQEREELQELIQELLNTQLLNEVVQQWSTCWKANKTKISPQTVRKDILEGNNSQTLLPDSRSYNLVLDALTKRYSNKKATEHAKKILERMVYGPSFSSTASASRNSMSPAAQGKDIYPDTVTYTILINIFSKGGNAQAAEDILNRMQTEYLGGRSTVKPNVRTFTSVISAWARSRASDAPEKAEAIVSRMNQLDQNKTLDCQISPNLITYNAVLDCWAKSGRDEAGAKAEALLRKMEQMSDLKPDTISYNTVILAYLRGPNSLEGAEAILRRQIAEYKFKDNAKGRPDLDSFNMVLEAIHKNSANDEDAPLRAERLLKHMVQLKVQPNLLSYNSVLGCWANSKLERAGGRAEFILHEMVTAPEKAIKFPTKVVRPNTLSYNSVIAAYARAGKSQSAEMVFRAMYTEYRKGNKSVKPTLRTFNTVLSAWSHTPTATDVERLKAVLKLMHELPRTGVVGVKPDVVSYNTLLSCLARIDSDECRRQTEEVLLEMERRAMEDGDEAVQPDKYSYTSVMQALARAGEVEKTRKLLDRMFEQFKKGNEKCRPDRFSFDCVLQAISKSAKGRHIDAGKEADAVYNQMNDYYTNGLLADPPSKFTYDLRINCWGNSGDFRGPEKAEEILKDMQGLAAQGYTEFQPDEITFSNVINAHAKRGSFQRAEELLGQMFQEYTNGNKSMKPTLNTINMVLASLARSKAPGAAEKAEVYLREMLAFQHASAIELKPDVVTFTTVITCWANSGDPMAAEHVKSLFRQLELMSQSGDHINLDAGFYRSMLRACAQAGDTASAESLLDEIVNGDQERAIQPDRYMYHALMQAYAASNDDDAPDKADKLLQEMDALAEKTGNSLVKPDNLCYLTVLECWAKSKEVKRAADRSEELLIEMEEKFRNGYENVKPSPATYSRVINTMARAGDIERTKKILKRMYTGGIEGVGAVVPVHA